MSGGNLPAAPPSTRSATRKATFDRVLKDVMGIDDDDFLIKALDNEGIDSVPDLLTLTDDQIDNLAYVDDDGNVKSPSLANRNKLRILRAWNQHLQQVQGKRRIDWLDTTTVNEDEWDEYRIGIYVPQGVVLPNPAPSIPSVQTASPSVPTPRYTTTSNPAADFRKGIKRDKTHYKEITDEKQWDDFKRNRSF